MKKILLALVPAAFLAAPAFADDVSEIVFRAIERQIILEYYRQHGSERADQGHGNKGRAKSLPPGIAKKLARGGKLPPGIVKRELPPELRERLPEPPKGHERVIIDGRILLVDIVTGVIRDRLEEIVLGD